MSKKRNKNTGGEQLRCPGCGAPSDASDRFCRKCGTPLTGEAKPNGKPRGLTGLRAFGLAIVALAVVYAFLLYGGGGRSDPPPAQPIPVSAIGSGPASQPLTPRAAADQLFNQAMTAHETGDVTSAQRFIPVAITAYLGLESLDPDARYHVALLALAADRPGDAIAQADTILSEVPEHLLALSVSARAYQALGNDDMAAQFWQRFLDAYTPETAASRQEYIDHGRALPLRRDAAEGFLRERGLR